MIKMGINMKTIKKESLAEFPQTDSQILSSSIIAELDADNLYKQYAASAKDPRVKKVLIDIE